MKKKKKKKKKNKIQKIGITVRKDYLMDSKNCGYF